MGFEGEGRIGFRRRSSLCVLVAGNLVGCLSNGFGASLATKKHKGHKNGVLKLRGDWFGAAFIFVFSVCFGGRGWCGAFEWRLWGIVGHEEAQKTQKWGFEGGGRIGLGRRLILFLCVLVAGGGGGCLVGDFGALLGTNWRMVAVSCGGRFGLLIR